jgi:hypothetical protein
MHITCIHKFILKRVTWCEERTIAEMHYGYKRTKNLFFFKCL